MILSRLVIRRNLAAPDLQLRPCYPSRYIVGLFNAFTEITDNTECFHSAHKKRTKKFYKNLIHKRPAGYPQTSTTKSQKPRWIAKNGIGQAFRRLRHEQYESQIEGGWGGAITNV